MSADVAGDVSRCGRWCQQVTWQWWHHLGLTSAGADLARVGAWRRMSAWRRVRKWMEARAEGFRHVERVSFGAESLGSAWRCVWAPMVVRFPRGGRSTKDNLVGTCKNTIGASITAMTVWQWSRDSERSQLQVRNQRWWLNCVRGLTANGCSSSCNSGSNCESGITPMRDKTAKKKSERSLWYHVRNIECNSIVFLKSKNIHHCLYIRGICVRYK